jgi:hypothetical protein
MLKGVEKMTAKDSRHAPNTEEAISEANNSSQKKLSETALVDRLAYSRSLFDNLIEWYKNADAKAQVILSLDGAFLAFLTVSIFTKRQDFLDVIDGFGAETWWSLILMCAALLGSIGCAISCLWSRLIWPCERERDLNAPNLDADVDAIAKIIWFFQFIAKQDFETFRGRLNKVDGELEQRVLSIQILELSKRVLVKHKLVNIGFLLTGASLLLFLVGGISYIVRAKGERCFR